LGKENKKASKLKNKIRLDSKNIKEIKVVAV
jgi:hypothetical protein